MLMHQADGGLAKIEARMGGETLMLPQGQIARLHGLDVSVISRHIRNIFIEGELEADCNLQNSTSPQRFTA
jgi:hypothetical protein